MSTAFITLFNIFATPTEAFENLKERPGWLFAFAIISFVAIGIAFFTIPLTDQIAQLALSRSLNKAQIRQALAVSEQLKYIGLAFVPAQLLFRWLFFSAMLYFSAILLGAKEVRFKQVYAILVFAEMILLLMSIINILLLYIKGIDNIHQTKRQTSLSSLSLIVSTFSPSGTSPRLPSVFRLRRTSAS